MELFNATRNVKMKTTPYLGKIARINLSYKTILIQARPPQM